MKRLVVLSAVVALSLAAIPLSRAQSDDMKGMDMMEKDKIGKSADNKSEGKSHKGVGTVKKVDPTAGTVTLEHGPVKSLNWPAMTMTFIVKDRALLEKLTLDKKVEFEFAQRGPDYVITTVK
jgi:Cu(I)/Ag(I) efflux system periplasmic protein CusF